MTSSTTFERRLFAYQVIIFTSLFIGYACYAYNRKSVSAAMPRLMEEGLGRSQAGLIVSSQNMAYAISKFLGGILSDSISARLLFSSGLVMSGVVTIAFSQSDCVWLFTLLWFLNGFSQGAGWPACAKVLRQWFSPLSFGRWWSILSASANVSGGCSPFIAAYFILHYGWRTSVLVSGVVSVFFGILSIFAVINSPVNVGMPTFAKPPRKDSISNSADAMTVLSSPFIWIICACYMMVFCTKTSAVDWGQLYLMDDHRHDQYVGSTFTSSVEWGGFVGGILSGYLGDWAATRRRNQLAIDPTPMPTNPRMRVAILFTGLTITALHLMYFTVNSQSSIVWICSVGFILGAGLFGAIIIYGVVATEAAPVALSGTAHAIVALAANIGAIMSGLPFATIASYTSWSMVFLLLEGLSIITLLTLLLTRNVTAHIIASKSF